MEEQLFKEDLYKLFDVDPEADTKTIRKAYRQLAKTCHPDKNPDDKSASDKFHKLSEALKILVDEDKRIQYDVKRKAKKRQEFVFNQMNKNRQSAKANLEEREEYFRQKKEEDDFKKSKADRLREESSKILAEELRIMKEEIEREKRMQNRKSKISRTQESQAFRLKVHYNPNTLDESSVTEIIEEAFSNSSRSNGVSHAPPFIAFSKKSKKSEGIIETSNFQIARSLVNDQIDEDNLRISWYETPIPPTDEDSFPVGLNKQQRDFFLLEADVLTALRKRSRID